MSLYGANENQNCCFKNYVILCILKPSLIHLVMFLIGLMEVKMQIFQALNVNESVQPKFASQQKSMQIF